jgi:hypothetical protein
MKGIGLRDALGEVTGAVDAQRRIAPQSRAALSVYQVLTRFILEAALVVGFFLFGCVCWLTGGQAGAATSAALLATAGFGAAPSLIDSRRSHTGDTRTHPPPNWLWTKSRRQVPVSLRRTFSMRLR